MRRTKLIAIPMALSAALASAQVTVFSTTNLGFEDPVLGTARYEGMAGAMGALGGNSSTVKDNPAGIATSTKSDAGLSFNVHSNSEGKASFNMNDASALFNVNHNTKGYVSSAFMVSYNRLRNYSHGLYRYGMYKFEDYNVSFTDEAADKGGAGEVNFAYAGNINNMFFFGVSLGVSSLSYEQRSVYNEQDWYCPKDFYREIEGWGCNFKAGVIVQPTDFLRIGASIQTPTKYECKEWWQNKEPDVDEQGYSIVHLTDSEYDYELHLPFKVSAGLGFMIGDRANVGLDYSMRNYQKTWVEMGGLPLRDIEIDAKGLGQVQHTMKVGAEINVVGGLDIRCGYAFTSAPLVDGDEMKKFASSMGGLYLDADYETGYVPDYGVTLTGSSHYITGGFGYTGKTGYVDFAYCRRLTNEQYFDAIPNPAYGQSFDNLNIESVRRGANDFTLTLGLRF